MAAAAATTQQKKRTNNIQFSCARAGREGEANLCFDDLFDHFDRTQVGHTRYGMRNLFGAQCHLFVNNYFPFTNKSGARLRLDGNSGKFHLWLLLYGGKKFKICKYKKNEPHNTLGASPKIPCYIKLKAHTVVGFCYLLNR